MATEITIVTTRTVPSLDLKRVGQSDTVVIFQVGDKPGPPDHVLIPSDKPSQQDILNAIRERLKARVELEGKKFTL